MHSIHRIMLLFALVGVPLSASAEDEPPAEESAGDEGAEVGDEAEEAATDGAADEDEDADADEAASDEAAVTLPADFFVKENTARAKTNRIGMLTLGGWALANFGWATVGLLRTEDDRERSFHLANAGLNLVNAGIAVTGFFSNAEQDWSQFDAVRTLNEDHSAEKMYLLAAGLDLALVATGAYLTAKGNLDRKEGVVGTGRSFMLQGGFLFTFDAVMYTIHALRRGKFTSQLGE